MPIAQRSKAARFLFESKAVDKEALFPIRFKGYEEINRIYRYDIDLVSDDPNIDLAALINQPAKLIMRRIGEDFEQFRPIQGIVVDFQMVRSLEEYAVYRAVLVPKLWLASLTHKSRIFKEMTVPEMIREVLKPYDIRPEFDLGGKYEPREYCVQYQESDLNFISRLMEFEGLSYFFKHDDSKESLMISDKPGAFAPIDVQDAIQFHQGLRKQRELNEKVEDLVCRERIVSSHVILQDYNYRTPDTDLRAETKPEGEPDCVHYEYGHHYKDPGSGKRLAQVRHEEIACQRRVLTGRSTCAGMQAGFTFTVKGHARDDMNQEFLLTRVEHEGTQFGFMGGEYEASFFGTTATDVAGDGQSIKYVNTFRCIPASVPFRPPRITRVPRVHGIMTATVIGDGGGYAALDDQGRYWAQMHFDLENKGSRPIRMAQPYTGKGHAGFHLPPHPGTEMLWSCIDGDPDRPYAIGSGPNPNNGAPVTSENNSQHIFRTTSDNLFLVEDKKDQERITLETPRFESVLTLGDKWKGGEGCSLITEEKALIKATNGVVMHAANNGFVISGWKNNLGGPGIGEQIQTALPLAAAIIASTTGKFIKGADSPFGLFYKIVKTANKLWGYVGLANKSLKAFGADNGFTKFMEQFDTPGVFVTCQGGIDFVNNETYSVVTGGGFSVVTPADVNMVSADGIGLSTGASVSIFARHGDIQAVADKKNVVMNAGNSIFLRAGEVEDEPKRKSLGEIGKGIVDKFKKVFDKTEVLPDHRIQFNAKDGIYLNAENGEVIIQSQKKEIAMAADKLALGGENGVEIFDEKKQIELKCGDSSIVMKKDGTITIKGKKITIEGTGPTGSITLDAQEITENAKGDMKMNGMNIKADAKMKNTMTGTMVNSEAKGIHTTKGGMAKIN